MIMTLYMYVAAISFWMHTMSYMGRKTTILTTSRLSTSVTEQHVNIILKHRSNSTSGLANNNFALHHVQWHYGMY